VDPPALLVLVAARLRGRLGFRSGSSTVPFAQIGHSAVKRLWRQNTDTGAKCSGRRETPATIPAVHTVVVSDLHLGSLTGSDLAARPAARRRLAESVAGADRVVLLGDLLELRERRLAEALALAQPLFDALAEAVAGRRVVLVPGNHDHALAEPWLGRLRLEGRPLGSENEWRVEAGDGLAGRLSALLPEADVTLAYPGLFLRPDVYATHGHYLDLHLTVPRLESIAATAMGRLTRRGGAVASAGDYEAVLAPMYAFYDGLAEAAPPSALRRGGALSRGVWERVNGDGRVARLLLGRVTIPAAVAALNRLGLGPLRPELTGEELRRAGLAAMGRVADVLAPEARHVLFGHTHRPGPLAGDDGTDWRTPAGARLWNTGTWLHEVSFVPNPDRRNPYWPGTILWLDDTGEPRLENVLEELPA
jgi:predicted phosphodiesterase